MGNRRRQRFVGREIDREAPREDTEFRETLAAPAERPVVVQEERAGDRSGYYIAANIVYVLLGVLETILALRFLFLLFGANSGNSFVNYIYGLSEPFLAPFYGVFGSVNVTGPAAIFDGSTLVAMVVYALIGWALLRLIAAIFNRPVDPL